MTWIAPGVGTSEGEKLPSVVVPDGSVSEETSGLPDELIRAMATTLNTVAAEMEVT